MSHGYIVVEQYPDGETFYDVKRTYATKGAAQEMADWLQALDNPEGCKFFVAKARW